MTESHPPTSTRRHVLRRLAAVSVTAALPAAWAQKKADKAAPIAVEVWKDASCGCCHDWITQMEQNGFKVTAHDIGNNAVRARLGLAAKYGSCHTALIGGYVVEGHVPAADVQRLLREKPQALGIAVPGMPIGSPGMDGPAYGGRKDKYDTLLVLRDGTSKVFQSHG